jgi:hypothetical protein
VSEREGLPEVVQVFPVGRAVEVYVNPESPGDAVLMRGVHGKRWFHLIIGCVFVFVSILGALGVT